MTTFLTAKEHHEDFKLTVKEYEEKKRTVKL